MNLDRIVMEILDRYRGGGPNQVRLNFLILHIAPLDQHAAVRERLRAHLGVCYPHQ